MGGMRRLASLCLAAGYSVSFLAVCLAACLTGPMTQDHACCSGEQGIRAVETDCCFVVAGVSHGGSDMTPASPASAVSAETLPRPEVAALQACSWPVRAASSPPRILRI